MEAIFQLLFVQLLSIKLSKKSHMSDAESETRTIQPLYFESVEII